MRLLALFPVWYLSGKTWYLIIREPGLMVTVQWGDCELPACTQEWDRLPVRRAAAGHYQADNNSELKHHSKEPSLSILFPLSCPTSSQFWVVFSAARTSLWATSPCCWTTSSRTTITVSGRTLEVRRLILSSVEFYPRGQSRTNIWNLFSYLVAEV